MNLKLLFLPASLLATLNVHASGGIEVYTSTNLKEWKLQGLALNKDDVWADRKFWAPEIYKVNGKFYMYYSADEHICVATSDSPLGPFKQTEQKPMILDEKCIDNSLFIDDNGKPYLFFVRFNDGNNVWVAELESDLTTIKKETMHPCIHGFQLCIPALIYYCMVGVKKSNSILFV